MQGQWNYSLFITPISVFSQGLRDRPLLHQSSTSECNGLNWAPTHYWICLSIIRIYKFTSKPFIATDLSNRYVNISFINIMFRKEMLFFVTHYILVLSSWSPKIFYFNRRRRYRSITPLHLSSHLFHHTFSFRVYIVVTWMSISWNNSPNATFRSFLCVTSLMYIGLRRCHECHGL